MKFSLKAKLIISELEASSNPFNPYCIFITKLILIINKIYNIDISDLLHEHLTILAVLLLQTIHAAFIHCTPYIYYAFVLGLILAITSEFRAIIIQKCFVYYILVTWRHQSAVAYGGAMVLAPWGAQSVLNYCSIGVCIPHQWVFPQKS